MIKGVVKAGKVVGKGLRLIIKECFGYLIFGVALLGIIAVWEIIKLIK